MFLAVAGAVIGGTSLFGGVGTVIGGFIGVAVLIILRTGLNIIGVSAFDVRPDHRPRDPRVDDRERAGRAAQEPGEAAVSANAASTPAAIRVENIVEELRRRDGARRRLDAPRPGRGARPDRRQRRRQVDADQDPDRLPSGPTRGEIFVNGEEVVHPLGRPCARSLGIDTVYQDLALVPTLSVAHNMFLKREIVRGCGPFRMLNNREMRRRAREYDRGASGSARSARSARRSRCSRAGSARRSRSRARCTRGRASCCSTSRSRRWARARGRSSST